jgi:hypothetical protein
MRTRTGEPLNLLRSSPKDLLANEGANSNDSQSAQAMRGGSETECERNDVLLGNGEHRAKYTRAAWGAGGLPLVRLGEMSAGPEHMHGTCTPRGHPHSVIAPTSRCPISIRCPSVQPLQPHALGSLAKA